MGKLLVELEARRQSSLLNSNQLELKLDDVRLSVPWDGRSPRGLTQVASSFIFEARAKKGRPPMMLPASPEQLEFWPPRPGGASPLLPLPWEVHHG